MEHESIDLLISAEGSFYMDSQEWRLLALLLGLVAWGMWDEARGERGNE